MLRSEPLSALTQLGDRRRPASASPFGQGFLLHLTQRFADLYAKASRPRLSPRSWAAPCCSRFSEQALAADRPPRTRPAAASPLSAASAWHDWRHLDSGRRLA